jgi:hypothetical protein
LLVEDPTSRKSVTCVACRASYVPETDSAPGCPTCGGLSWVATWIASQAPPTTPGADYARPM